MDLPGTPTEIDAPWIARMLRDVPAFTGVEILGARVQTIGVGYGLDGSVAHVALETAGQSAERTLVVKLARAPRGSREIDFYEQLAADMPVRLPRFYAGRVDEGADRAVLLLEDLSHAVQGDAVQGASPSQAMAVLEGVARFHAAFLGADEDALPLPRWATNEERLISRVEERSGPFLERWGGRLDAKERAQIDGLVGRLPAAAALLAAAPTTLIHTDLHLDNVLFLEGDEPVFLDWTDARRGPAVLDVVRHFVEGMTAATRRLHGERLLACYRQARADAGQPHAGGGWAGEEARAAVLWHLAYTVGWAGAPTPGFDQPRVREIVESLVRNTTAAASDVIG